MFQKSAADEIRTCEQALKLLSADGQLPDAPSILMCIAQSNIAIARLMSDLLEAVQRLEEKTG